MRGAAARGRSTCPLPMRRRTRPHLRTASSRCRWGARPARFRGRRRLRLRHCSTCAATGVRLLRWRFASVAVLRTDHCRPHPKQGRNPPAYGQLEGPPRQNRPPEQWGASSESRRHHPPTAATGHGRAACCPTSRRSRPRLTLAGAHRPLRSTMRSWVRKRCTCTAVSLQGALTVIPTPPERAVINESVSSSTEYARPFELACTSERNVSSARARHNWPCCAPHRPTCRPRKRNHRAA